MDDHLARILKYLYNNQEFKSIEGEITVENAPALFSHAYVMQCQSLLKNLENKIAGKGGLLSKKNCSQFFLDSIKVSKFKIINVCIV